MKKFLVYLCVILVAVSTGFAIFFLVRDNEVISLGTTSLYKDVNSTFELALNVSDPNSYTKITLTSSNEDVLEITSKEIDLNNEVAKGSFLAKTGGVSRINFQTNNSKFRNLYCDVVIGDGSVNYPFHISTAEQLRNIGKILYNEAGEVIDNPYSLTSSYELVADIDLSTLDGEWLPIGAETNAPFAGTFNGNGYSINNLNAVNSNSKYVGLFQEISSTGAVKNLKFTNATITTSNSTEYAGVVAGLNMGTIQGIEIKSAQIYNNNSNAIVGGVTGYNLSVNTSATKTVARVDRCSVNISLNGVPASYDEETGEVVTEATAVKGFIGGLVGYNYGGVIINSYTTGTYNANSESTFAGIVYKNEYMPISTVAEGSVYSQDLGANVKDCYSIVTVNQEAEGILNVAGIMYQNIDKTDEPINKVMGNYYDSSRFGEYKGIYAKEDVQYVTEGRTSSELKTVNLPSHETFVYVYEGTELKKQPDGVAYWSTQAWFIDGTNEGYPVLKYDAKNVADDFGGTDEEMPELPTVENLNTALLNGLDKTFVITEDLDLSNVEWVPVGTVDAPFTGSLSVAINPATNAPFVIKGLKVTTLNYEYAGMFGVISGATITNLTLENANIVNNSHSYVGAVVGANGIEGKYAGGTINNANVINATLSGKVGIGGVAGTNSGVITNSEVISANGSTNIIVAPASQGYVGGITGLNYGTINANSDKDIYNKVSGNVKITATGDTNFKLMAGGVAGLNSGDISRVYVAINNSDNDNVYGVISDAKYITYAGGVAGYGNGKVDTAIVSARVIAGTNKANYVGGVVGYIENSKVTNVKDAYVYSSYLKATNVGGLVGYLAGNEEVAILYDEGNVFNALYGEQITVSDDYYTQENLVANITSSAVNDNVSLYGTYSGGLVCEIQRGFVTDCLSRALLCATNNAGFVYDIMYNKVNSTGGVITRCYVVANFSGGEENYNVTSSVIHSSNNINKRTAGFIDDYYYATDKGKGKNPSYFTGVTHTVVNWFKDDEDHDVTRERKLDTLRNESVWDNFDTQNATTGLSPWNIIDGSLPKLDIEKTYDRDKNQI